MLTLAKTLYAPSPTQSRTPHDTMPASLPPITSGPPESPLQAPTVSASLAPVLPAQTMWPATKELPYEPRHVASETIGSVAERRAGEMSSLVDVVRPQP